MRDGLLESIIQLEKRLQQQLERETALAEAWQVRELELLEARLAAARAAAGHIDQAALETARRAAEAEAGRVVAAAKVRAERLARLEESLLARTVRERLAMILPERDHDHPDGQG